MRRLDPEVLSSRDRAVLADLARVRLLSGQQIERLHFATLATGNARGSARRRSLARLADLGLVTTLPRRVGGERAGSAGLVYTLDARAWRERATWQPDAVLSAERVRRPWSVGWAFVRHTLDVAELYVRLVEAHRAGRLRLQRFDAEPASWFAGARSMLKPDAYVVLDATGLELTWWVEVDRATQSLPTIRRKLSRYIELYDAGSDGPDGVFPRVLFTVPDEKRRGDLVRTVADHGVPADLVVVVAFEAALDVLPGEQPRPPP